MNLPKELAITLADLLRDHHADGLYGLTLGLLGDQILPEPRESGVPAMLDTATVRQLIRAYGQQGHLSALSPVLGLLEPYLPVLQRSDPVLLSVGPTSSLANPAVRLTNREIQVLVGIANGLNNGEIGRSLYLSEDTVKTHNRRLFKKLGARDRAHAVRLGYDAGILPIRRPAPSAVAS
jgi:DNA-binding CsgD family transcriptional regulator